MISVAIATYNGQEFIKEQLLSILNQTMPVDEIVICDDQSSDDTVKIIQELLCDKIYLYQNEKNLGGSFSIFYAGRSCISKCYFF